MRERLGALLRSSEVCICHFDRREKAILLLLHALQDFSLRSKRHQKEASCESIKTDGEKRMALQIDGFCQNRLDKPVESMVAGVGEFGVGVQQELGFLLC